MKIGLKELKMYAYMGLGIVILALTWVFVPLALIMPKKIKWMFLKPLEFYIAKGEERYGITLKS